MSGDVYRPEVWWRVAMTALGALSLAGALMLLFFLSQDSLTAQPGYGLAEIVDAFVQANWAFTRG